MLYKEDVPAWVNKVESMAVRPPEEELPAKSIALLNIAYEVEKQGYVGRENIVAACEHFSASAKVALEGGVKFLLMDALYNELANKQKAQYPNPNYRLPTPFLSPASPQSAHPAPPSV